MNSRCYKGLLTLGILTATFAGAPHASATLGEGADSVTRDRKALSAAKKSTVSRARYTVQEIASASTTIREFVAPSGVVFAVAWNGLVHPDLTTLLGSYGEEYQKARQQIPRRRGQKSTLVQGERVVVETWGHMRNLQGRAYLPALVPAGVNVDEIR
jgi:hypothetical protein